MLLLLQSSLQIQGSAMLDYGMPHVHHLTPDCTCVGGGGGVIKNLHSVCQLFLITEFKFTKLVIQFPLF